MSSSGSVFRCSLNHADQRTSSSLRTISLQMAMAWEAGMLKIWSQKKNCRTPWSRTNSSISSTTSTGSRMRTLCPER